MPGSRRGLARCWPWEWREAAARSGQEMKRTRVGVLREDSRCLLDRWEWVSHAERGEAAARARGAGDDW